MHAPPSEHLGNETRPRTRPPVETMHQVGFGSTLCTSLGQLGQPGGLCFESPPPHERRVVLGEGNKILLRADAGSSSTLRLMIYYN